ncbi:MAG: relaxase/mobilization nuclease domain-containing protein, partial [Clostridia bacterium]|nr:relaxase/mobilization nuclease domain-containing protein [Clostridia bacterium]
MAVTRIWPIKGRLRNVIDYTVNPEKTFNPNYTFEDLQALKDVIDYAMESDKSEKQFYVTGVNCTADFAREQMVNTKRLFKKEDGILAFHGYQSFKPGEVTPELAHEIGIKLA